MTRNTIYQYLLDVECLQPHEKWMWYQRITLGNIAMPQLSTRNTVYGNNMAISLSGQDSN